MTSTKPPLIVICGSTGTGKSKLAIELACLFDGEVINADVVQLYKGLEIATNKVPKDELKGIPHHMLGILSPDAGQHYDVHEYRASCVPIIDKLRTNRKLPILTGGTHYYLESILWTDFLTNKDPDFEKAARTTLKDKLSLSAQDSYKLLKELNPTRADQLHPKNLRKVRTALLHELMQQRSGNASLESGTCSPEPKRFPNRSCQPRYPEESLIFWLDCALDVLDKSLDQRVNQMIERGLLADLDSFLNYAATSLQSNEKVCSDSCTSQTHSVTLSHLLAPDLENQASPTARRGILQSIGFKEFADYLALPNSPEGRQSNEGKRLLNEAIERVKISTRQYARRQIRWIVNRFLRRPLIGAIPVYRLDVTESVKSNSDTWTRTILAPAVHITHNYYSSRNIPLIQSTTLDNILNLYPQDVIIQPEPFVNPPETKSSPDSGPPYVCSSCSDRIFHRLEDFEAHCRGRAHQKRLAKLRRQSRADEIFEKSSRTLI